MKRKQQTKQCPTCNGHGEVPQGYKAESVTTSPWFVWNQAEQPADAIGPVFIPRAHARDFGSTAAVLGAGVCGLFGGTGWQIGYATLMAAATVYGVVRYLGIAQDNRRVIRREKIAASVIAQPAPQPAPTVEHGSNYLPVHAAPAQTQRAKAVAELRDFVNRCGQVGTGQNHWEAQGMKRDKYQQLRNLLINLGWARWKSENSTKSGWELAFTVDEINAGLFPGTMRDGNYPAPTHRPG